MGRVDNNIKRVRVQMRQGKQRKVKAIASCVFSESVSDSPLVNPLPAVHPQPQALSLEAAAAAGAAATVAANSDRRRLRPQRKMPKRRLAAGCCCWLARCSGHGLPGSLPDTPDLLPDPAVGGTRACREADLPALADRRCTGAGPRAHPPGQKVLQHKFPCDMNSYSTQLYAPETQNCYDESSRLSRPWRCSL